MLHDPIVDELKLQIAQLKMELREANALAEALEGNLVTQLGVQRKLRKKLNSQKERCQCRLQQKLP